MYIYTYNYIYIYNYSYIIYLHIYIYLDILQSTTLINMIIEYSLLMCSIWVNRVGKHQYTH